MWDSREIQEMRNETQGVFQNFSCFRRLNNSLLHKLSGVKYTTWSSWLFL